MTVMSRRPAAQAHARRGLASAQMNIAAPKVTPIATGGRRAAVRDVAS
jgi:hypothetical protein